MCFVFSILYQYLKVLAYYAFCVFSCYVQLFILNKLTVSLFRKCLYSPGCTTELFVCSKLYKTL